MARVSWIARLGVPVVGLCLCLVIAGCGGKLTKANADRVNNGMSEQEVSSILGAPNESSEVSMPDIGAMMPGGMSGMPGLNAVPKKAKQSVWKDGNKVVTILFVDGKVTSKTMAGF